jgi:hypothetical protein
MLNRLHLAVRSPDDLYDLPEALAVSAEHGHALQRSETLQCLSQTSDDASTRRRKRGAFLHHASGDRVRALAARLDVVPASVGDAFHASKLADIRLNRRLRMLMSKRPLLFGAAARGLAGFAWAQGSSQVIGDLADKEAMYVDLKEFKIHKGRVGAKAASQLGIVDAREVSEGAVIVRSGAKLYLVDTKPRDSTPQAMKDFWDSIPLPMR